MAGKQRTPSRNRTASTPHLNHNGAAAHNGLERERVTGLQRARMLTAMAEVACRHGAGNVTVGHVVESAGVSRRTFYELFSDSEDCLLGAFEHALQSAYMRVLTAYRADEAWRLRIRSGLHALLQFLDEEPYLGRLLIVESLASGRVLERRSRVLAKLVSVVHEGRKEARAGSQVTPLAAEGVVGGVLSVLHGRMLNRDEQPLAELLNPLMGMIVTPYLGAGAARRELSRPVAKAPAPLPPAPASPLRGLGMRLTYRTVQVLVATGVQPGSSNRRIGEAAGMSDPGQISKLLARLQRLGLIENTGAGHARGEPNAWRLTARGQTVNEAIVKRGFG